MFKNYLKIVIGLLVLSAYSPFLYLNRFGIKKVTFNIDEDDTFSSAQNKDKLKALSTKFSNNATNINSGLTDKRFVLDNYEHFLNREYNDKVLTLSTSGTTGQGLKFPVTREFMHAQWTIFDKQFKIAGVHQLWRLQFSGRDLKIFGLRIPILIDPYAKKIYANQYCLNENQVLILLKLVKFFSIRWLHGYPSMVVDFIKQSEHLIPNSIKGIQDLTVTLSSETFTEQQRNFLRKFNIENIFNMYGQTEGVANFFTCEFGWMHVNESFSIVEFIQDHELFEIVGTSLHNKAFQFFRYKTGDFVERVHFGYCECGRNSRRVEKILGRQDDYVVLKDGSKVGRLDHLTKGDMRVYRAQIVQDQPGTFRMYISCDPEVFDDLRNILLKKCKGYFGNNADIEIVFTDIFHTTSSGKWKFVINNIPHGQIL